MTEFLKRKSINSIGDFRFWLSGFAVRSYSMATGIRPSSRPYVSGDSFRAVARHVLDKGGSLDARRVGRGDIVFVDAREIPRFGESILPGIRERFILVSHNSDRNIDGAYARLADDRRILAWFAMNAVLRHPKVHPLPIGLENRWKHNNGIIGDFDRLRALPAKKAMRIIYAFSVATNEAERRPALEAIRSSPIADGPSWTLSRSYRERLNGYAFTLSPPGNGFDCHRTWEALYLGTIPIVKRSPFFEAFPELPALIVDDWREVTAWDEDFLRLSYDRLQPTIASCPYLWMDHWIGEFEKWRNAIGEK
jgi:hypothetical protein